jgi:hypothetical protein
VNKIWTEEGWKAHEAAVIAATSFSRSDTAVEAKLSKFEVMSASET